MNNETNMTCNATVLTPEQKRILENYSWWMETVGHLIVGCIGIVLNSTTILVMSSKQMWKQFFNRLITLLAVFDIVYLVCEMSETFRHRTNTEVQHHIFVRFVYPVRNIVMCSSVYMIVIIAWERYLALNDPMAYRLRSKIKMNKRLGKYLLIILSFNVMFYSLKFFDLNVEDETDCRNLAVTESKYNEMLDLYWNWSYSLQNNITNVITYTNKYQLFVEEFCTTRYSLVATKLRTHPHYVLWYINFANFIFTAAIPLLFLVLLNYKMCKALNNFKRRRPSVKSNRLRNSSMHMDRSRSSSEVDKTVVCRAIIIIFVVCHSVRFIINTEEFITIKWYNGCRGRSTWTMYAKSINQLSLISVY